MTTGSENGKQADRPGSGRSVSQEELATFLDERGSYFRRILAASLRRFHFDDSIDAEDILQEATLAALRNLDTFVASDDDSVDRWMGKIVRRKRAEVRKSAQRIKRGGHVHRVQQPAHAASSYVDLLQTIGAEQRTVSSEAAMRDAAEAVRIALHGLPETYSQPIAMHYIEGRSQIEVAASLNISPKAAQTRIARGLAKLRKQVVYR